MKRTGLLLAGLFIFACWGSAEAKQTGNFTFTERGEAIGKLYRMGLENKTANIPTFCEALKDKDAAVREAAIAQLIFTHDERAIEPVIGVMKDESRLVRRSAIAVLARIGSKRAIPALTEALTYYPSDYKKGDGKKPDEPLRQEEYFNRLAAAVALHRLGSDAGKATVLEVLRTPQQKQVYLMALQTVMEMGMKEATPECIKMARTEGYIGEDSPALFGLRALWHVGDEAQREEILKVAMEKKDAIGMHAPIWSLALLVKFGGPENGVLFKERLAKAEEHETQMQCILGLEKFKTEGAAEVIAKTVLQPKGVNKKTNEIAEREYKNIEMGCNAIGTLGDKSVIPALKELYKRYTEPSDWFAYRLQVAGAMARLGDQEGTEDLHQALGHEDAAVRRMAAQLLGKVGDKSALELLVNAAKKETEPSTFEAEKASIVKLEPLWPEIAVRAPKSAPAPKDTYGKPRFAFLSFDDCATPAAMERFCELSEELAAHDVPWGLSMNYAPLSRYDYEYNGVLMQRLFDRGCEIENHTLHHDPDGRGVRNSTDDELRAEIGGGNNWLRSHIMGLDKIYHWYSGGGAFTRPGDPVRLRRDVNEIAREGNFSHDIRPGWQVTNFADWDLFAPPFHRGRWEETKGQGSAKLISARSQGDLRYGYDAEDPQERIRAFAATVDYWYFKHPETVMVITGHDWPNAPIPDRPGNEKHWEIFSGGMKEVLLKEKDRYPLLHTVSDLECTYLFSRHVDIRELLARKANLQTEAK